MNGDVYRDAYIVLLWRLRVLTVFHIVHPYITIHSISRILYSTIMRNPFPEYVGIGYA